MRRTIEGNLLGTGLRLAIVAARFNGLITRNLVEGALDGFRRHGIDESDIDVAWVPGAFEIPLVARKLARLDHYHAILCLGAIIRGATSHYDLVASEVTSGVAAVASDTGVPTIFGVITTETIEQALERAGTKAGNKGYECAVSAIEMANLMRVLEAGNGTGR